MSDIAIFGAGGFGLEVASYLRDLDQTVSHIVDEGTPRLEDMRSILGSNLALHTSLESLARTNVKKVVIAIGEPLLRRTIAFKVKEQGLALETVLHPRAYIAHSASISAGCILAPFSFVGPFATLAENVAVNVRGSIGHDAQIEAHCVLSPHVALNGQTHCREATFLGAGAVMLPGTQLGAFSKVSSGSVLKEDFPDGFLLHGNPAKGRQMFAVPTTAT